MRKKKRHGRRPRRQRLQRSPLLPTSPSGLSWCLVYRKHDPAHDRLPEPKSSAPVGSPSISASWRTREPAACSELVAPRAASRCQGEPTALLFRNRQNRLRSSGRAVPSVHSVPLWRVWARIVTLLSQHVGSGGRPLHGLNADQVQPMDGSATAGGDALTSVLESPRISTQQWKSNPLTLPARCGQVRVCSPMGSAPYLALLPRSMPPQSFGAPWLSRAWPVPGTGKGFGWVTAQ